MLHNQEWPTAKSDRYDARLRPAVDVEYLTLPPWRIPAREGHVGAYVMVEDYCIPAIRIDLVHGRYYPFNLLAWWNDVLLIGFQDQLHLVRVEPQEVSTVDLEDNVESGFCGPDYLLISDRTGVYRLDANCSVIWHRGGLGLAWTAIVGVGDGQVQVFACQEVDDPPLGDDMRLCLATGAIL